METQNDGLEKMAPFKYGHFWYLHVKFVEGKHLNSLYEVPIPQTSQNQVKQLKAKRTHPSFKALKLVMFSENPRQTSAFRCPSLYDTNPKQCIL